MERDFTYNSRLTQVSISSKTLRDVSSQKAEKKDCVEKMALSDNRLANFLFSRVKGLKPKAAVDCVVYSSGIW